MADPLSITASVITLIQVSIQVAVLLKQFRDEVSVVDTTLSGLLKDVEDFQQVLESMKETFDQEDLKVHLQVTGHVGSHWKNLARSLKDGTETLEQLHSLLDGVNKTTSWLDGPRKQLRFKSAIDQIATFRDQIRSYRGALQLSLSTVILWNQVTFQKSTEQIPEKIIPNLDKLYEEFRNLGILLNTKIEKLQSTVSDQNSKHELDSMSNLRECVRSAADVVSTASSTLTVDNSDIKSIKYGSDFGDIFSKDANEPMLRWMDSNTVYEFEDPLDPVPKPGESNDREGPSADDPSDSDSDIESETIKALLKIGTKRKDAGDLAGAESLYRNCLSRFARMPMKSSYSSLQNATVSGVSKAEVLTLLVETYCLLGNWGKAKTCMVEKISITERHVGKTDETLLWDTMKLAELMMSNKEYMEAHLQGRRSLRGFKKLGENGQKGYEQCLVLLIEICKGEDRVDESEAYAALLETHHARMKQFSSSVPLDTESSATELARASSQRASIGSFSSPINRKSLPIDVPVPLSTQDSASKVQAEGSADPPPAVTPDTSVSGPKIQPRLALTETYVESKAQGPNTDQSSPEPKIHPRLALTETYSLPDLPSIIVSPDATPTNLAKDLDDSQSSLPADMDATSEGANLRRSASDSHLSRPEHKEESNEGRAVVFTSRGLELGLNSDLANRYQRWQEQRKLAMSLKPPTQEPHWTDPTRDIETTQMASDRKYPPLYDPSLLLASSPTPNRDRSASAPGARITDIGLEVVAEPFLPIARTYEDGLEVSNGASSSALPDSPFATPDMFRDVTRTPDPMTVHHGRTLERPGWRPERSAPRLELPSEEPRGDSTVPFLPSCPICSSSLSGLSDEGASVHVNSCMDGKPISVAKLREMDKGPNASAPVAVTTDSKTEKDVPRGTWACCNCKSLTLRFLSEKTCPDCGHAKDSSCPTSGNYIGSRKPTFRTPLEPVPSHKGGQVRRKLILLGDTLCGKSWLAHAWNKGAADLKPNQHMDEIFENYVRTITVERVSVEMITWDNSGMEGQERLRRMSYEQVHVVLICFDMSSWDSLDNVSTVWGEEANHYLKNVPRILVGCKADLLEDTKTIAEWTRQGQRPSTTQEAEEVAQKIKAIAYFETSAKESKGLDELFEYAVKASLVKTQKKGIRRFLSRSEIKFVR